MRDEQRLTQMKKDYDALKVELGVTTNEFNKLKAELKDQYGIKSLKEAEKLLEKLDKEFIELQKKRDTKFTFIEEQLQKYRR